MKNNQTNSIIKLVAKTSTNDLRQFIIHRCQLDTDFYKDFTAQFGELNTDYELAKTKEEIGSILNNTESNNFISDKECQVICDKLWPIIDKYRHRLKQGYHQHALNGFLLIYQAGGSMLTTAFDDSNSLDHLFSMVDNALIEFSDTVLNESEDKKIDYTHQIIKTFNGQKFDDRYEYCFNALASMLPIITDKSFDVIQKTTKYSSVHNSDPNSYYVSKSCILNTKILLQLNHLQQAKAYMEKHIQINGIRKMRIDLAIEEKDFELAAQYCLDADDSKRNDSWKNYLIKINKMTNQR